MNLIGFISRAVILVGCNDIDYNDNSDITMLFSNENWFFLTPLTIN